DYAWKDSIGEPKIVTQTLAPHAYACSPRICVLPITPTSLATYKSNTPTHMRSLLCICVPTPPPSCPTIFLHKGHTLHAYACYHNTQHHHSPSCLTYLHTKATLPRICITFYAYAWYHPYPPSLNQNHPRLCAITYAYAWNTSPRNALHIPSPNHGPNFSNPPTHMRITLRICVAIISYFQPHSPVSPHMRATLRICVETSTHHYA
ncbi:hypothetical protein PIB30_104197, partial [Stylosanthes scabra]|nr:hypothetical protein [Stylosanthes scabra]